MTGKIMVVAGEISGDERAAEVVEKIKHYNPRVEFFGMGSDKLKEQGVDIIIDPTDINSIGFLEALQNYKIHKSNYNRLKEAIKKRKPDVLFLVDYSGFNMLMARLGAKLNIPVVDYFPPSAWLWGEWRAKRMAKYDALIAANFPMERDVYIKKGARTEFVGHPLVDEIEVELDKNELEEVFEIGEKEIPIALLPGSRKEEIEKLLPLMVEAAVKLKEDNYNYVFIIPSANPKFNEYIESVLVNYPIQAKIVNNHVHSVLKMSHFAIVTSGTATLEAMLLSTPMLIIYKISSLTYKVAKLLYKKDYFGMPNILAEKEIVPEIVQEEVTVENIYNKAHYILSKPYLITDIKIKLLSAAEKLGSTGTIDKTAKLVLKEGNIDVLQR
ncbi:MAG: lipid-A-disaccharide synthase [Halanaerobiales bacterium]|nr:lipid-A-disaccharide synthase [Halanaerobiales bacterium]